MATSLGKKVTTDPRGQQPINEAVGVVTSDSLAAESLNSGGSFGAGNPKAAASKQPSSSTTTNTTDTSGATTLPSAVDSEAREVEQGWNEEYRPNADAGAGKEQGVGPTWNTKNTKTGGGGGGGDTGGATGGNTSAAGGHSSGTGSHTSATGGVPGNTPATGGVPGKASVGHAGGPTGGYAGSAIPPESQKPKGQNISEGGFDSGAPNASFNSEIGSKDDPGRLAENKFQKMDAQDPADAAGRLQQGGVDGKTWYDPLKSEKSA